MMKSVSSIALFLNVLSLLHCTTDATAERRRQPSTKGNEFVLGFMRNTVESTTNLELLVSTDEPHNVTFRVEARGLNFNETYVAVPNKTTTVPLDQRFVVKNENDRNKGILVKAEGDNLVSVIGFNEEEVSSDAFLALPCHEFNEYAPSNYKYFIFSTTIRGTTLRYKSQFLIVPCRDNTSIKVLPTQAITLQADTTDTMTLAHADQHISGQLKNLHRLQTVLIQAPDDLTGTILISNQPISVFTGHECGQVPFDVSACDFLVEQVPPHISWGTKFLTTPFGVRRSGEHYRIGSIVDGNEVTVTCTAEDGARRRALNRTVVNKGEYAQFNTRGRRISNSTTASSGSNDGGFVREFCAIETSKPAIVMQYMKGHSADEVLADLGDPSLLFVPSIGQYSDHVIVSTENPGETVFTDNNYISFAIPEPYFRYSGPGGAPSPEDLLGTHSNLYVDNTEVTLDRNYSLIYCSDDVICGYGTYTNLSHGSHVIRYNSVGGPATSPIVYGLAMESSYGYVAGYEMIPMGLPNIIASNITVFEGEEVTHLVLKRDGGDCSVSSEVTVTTRDGTAIAGIDYVPLTEHRVRWKINSLAIRTEDVFNITILNDSVEEDVEYFELVIKVKKNGFIDGESTTVVRVTIYDEDTVEYKCNQLGCHDYAHCETDSNEMLYCVCNDGFSGDGHTCDDIDECSHAVDGGEAMCSEYAECINTVGSYNCSCREGFVGNGFVCQDINECLSGSHDCHSTLAECTNTKGSFTCTCRTGYHGDGTECIDINECLPGGDNNCHAHARCTNTEGSFTCYCLDGFQGDGVECTVIITCEELGCHDYARCEPDANEMLHCVCNDGFTGDGHTCNDIDECDLVGEEAVCSEFAECTNTVGSYNCSCRDGFYGNGIDCLDIDECLSGDHNCHATRASCTNTKGSFTCTCRDGYYGDGVHCTGNPTSCDRGNQHCLCLSDDLRAPDPLIRNNGDDQCYCIEGYRENPDNLGECIDIDECSSPRLHNCKDLCVNTPGSFVCACSPGLFLNPDGRTCSDIDECSLEGFSDCNPVNATCTNTKGSHVCTCKPGLFGDGITCEEDVDECALQTHNCEQLCFNTNESFFCACRGGYYLKRGTACVDIDECLLQDFHDCDVNAMCTNTEGSFTCTCNNGYYGNGTVCLDIDECDSGLNNCSLAANCTNLPGDFNCTCREEYEGDGIFCKKIPVVRTEDPLPEPMVTTPPNPDGCNCNSASERCVEDKSTDSGFSCNCKDGYEAREGSDGGNNCTDIDECFVQAGFNPCEEDISVCVNTPGGYVCMCNDGFERNGTMEVHNCTDIDECLSANCSHSCVNTLGSFFCVCPTGYTLSDDEMTCKLSASFVTGITIGVILFIALCVGCVFLVLVCIKWRKRIFGRNCKSRNEVENLYHMANGNELQIFSVQSDLKVDIPRELIIYSSSIEIMETIGQGEFGVVYKAHILKDLGRTVTGVVAVKTLKGFLNETLIRELLLECLRMQEFDHPNVLKLTGVCLDGGPTPYLVMPFMANGSLLSYLKKERGTLVVPLDEPLDADEATIALKRLMDMTIQVAKGMEYLASKKIVHRDLAARNCMIDINYVIKVADFGLAESLETKDYFRQDKGTAIKLPVKWLAPESLTDYIFSEKSDVWAFGVTCWEIFSGGKTPYAGDNPSSLPAKLESGYRMERPANAACSDDVYTIILHCWRACPSDRPSFSVLVERFSVTLESMAGYLDVGAFS